jgi:nucleoredoxin
MALKELFGDKILTKDGEKDTDEALAGMDNIMIYFSAHWCPPCRGYTPTLSDAYKASEKKNKTAIVFASSDKDQAAFDDYYGSMSFFAIPYSARDKKDALSKKYGVSGIPTLVLLDGKGEKKEDNIRGKHGDYL